MATDSLVDARRKVLDPSVAHVNRSISDLERVYGLKQRKEFGLYLPGSSVPGNYVSTPDSVATSITGDFDLRAKIGLYNWVQGGANPQAVIMKRDVGGTNAAYGMRINVGGGLSLARWVAGVVGLHDSGVLAGEYAWAIKWIRQTLVTATGAVTDYTSVDGVTWTNVGSGTIATGATDDTSAPLLLGAGGVNQEMNGILYYAEVRNGINGPVVALFDPSTLDPTGSRTPASFVSSTGETWTINGTNWSWVAA